MFLIAICVLGASSAHAHVLLTGSMTGTASDSSGGVLPGVSVSLSGDAALRTKDGRRTKVWVCTPPINSPHDAERALVLGRSAPGRHLLLDLGGRVGDAETRNTTLPISFVDGCGSPVRPLFTRGGAFGSAPRPRPPPPRPAGAGAAAPDLN